LSSATQKELGWPAAATIIAAMIGAVAASIALAIAPIASPDLSATNHFASAREIGEVKARLEGIEAASRQMREELRDDIKELRKLIQVALEAKH